MSTSPVFDPRGRPTMMFIDVDRLGRPFAKDLSVVRFVDRYLMFYSVPPSTLPNLPPDGRPVSRRAVRPFTWSNLMK